MSTFWIGVSMLGIGKLHIIYKQNDVTITAIPAEKFYLMDVFCPLDGTVANCSFATLPVNMP